MATFSDIADLFTRSFDSIRSGLEKILTQKSPAGSQTDLQLSGVNESLSKLGTKLDSLISALSSFQKGLFAGLQAFQTGHSLQEAAGQAAAAMVPQPSLPGREQRPAWQQGLEKIKTGFTGEQNLGSIGEIIGGTGKFAGMVPKVGAPVEAFAKLTEIILKAVDKLQQWTERLHKSNMEFSEFSAAMAGVQARQEVREIQLSQERGERRGESAEFLAQAKMNLARETAPITDLFASLQNYIIGGLSNFAAALIKPLNEIGRQIGLLNKDDKKDDLLDSMKDAEDRGRKVMQRPNRFGNVGEIQRL